MSDADTSASAQPTSRLLPDKVVVITGASQGIGRAVAIGESTFASRRHLRGYAGALPA